MKTSMVQPNLYSSERIKAELPVQHVPEMLPIPIEIKKLADFVFLWGPHLIRKKRQEVLGNFD